MAPAVTVGVLVLLCIASVHAFNTAAGSVKAVDGIYDGRFGGMITVQAVFNQAGVRGNVMFTQANAGAPVKIHVNLLGLDQYNDAYPWSVHGYPVRSSLLQHFPCSNDNIGGIFNPNTTGGMIAAGNLGERNTPLRPDRPWQTFEDSGITLHGENSIIGRALVIDREDGPGTFICANIEHLGASQEILRATFANGVIQGDVIIRYSIGMDDATVEADLWRIDPGSDPDQTAMWSINHGLAGPNNTCVVSDDNIIIGDSPENRNTDCSRAKQRECPLGALSQKCGDLVFDDRRARNYCTDTSIGTSPRTYLVDENYPNDRGTVVVTDTNNVPLGCATLELVQPVLARAQFRGDGLIYGDFLFWQYGPDDRTYVRSSLTGLRDENHALRIFSGDRCDRTGPVFTRPNPVYRPPFSGTPTHDVNDIGNLDTLLPLEPKQRSLRTTVSSSSLPLFGPFTVVGKTLGLVDEDTNRIVACGPIMRENDYPTGELASLLGYQTANNPPLPPIM